jgi:endonuclease/exonuclease/phosphatase family metal-dependent hydrolase
MDPLKKYLALAIIFTILFLCACASPVESDALVVPTQKHPLLTVLSQNTMLIPLHFLAPSYPQRTILFSQILPKNYDIACLQEVFGAKSHRMIIDAWLKSIEDSYTYTPGWKDLDASDLRPNPISIKMDQGRYYVLGPQKSFLATGINSGLLILSKYPIIKAEAFCFSKRQGSDVFANKGVLYAKIMIGDKDQYIHVFNTHLQSHDYPKARAHQRQELFGFVTDIVGQDKEYIRPIIIAGDFNIRSGPHDLWLESFLESADQAILQEKEYSYAEYDTLKKSLTNNGEGYLDGKIIFEDLWLVFHEEQAGFTWVGKDIALKESSPYGSIGNVIAIEDGSPQRIDYIFFYPSRGSLSLKAQDISLVPQSPENFYCLKSPAAHIAGKDLDDIPCRSYSHTLSDHLGLSAVFEIMLAGPDD